MVTLDVFGQFSRLFVVYSKLTDDNGFGRTTIKSIQYYCSEGPTTACLFAWNLESDYLDSDLVLSLSFSCHTIFIQPFRFRPSQVVGVHLESSPFDPGAIRSF